MLVDFFNRAAKLADEGAYEGAGVAAKRRSERDIRLVRLANIV